MDFEKMAAQHHRQNVSVKASDVQVKDALGGTGEGQTGGEAKVPSSSASGVSRTPSAHASAFGGASAKAATTGHPHMASSLATRAAHFGRIALGHDEDMIDGEPLSVQERGHMGGIKGGPARAEVLTSTERTEIAREGGHARWGEGKSERDK